MHSTTRLQLRELNPHLLCVLCGGYLIDATTIIECIHSFCRTCIIKYLESSKYCPICDVQVHKTKPLLNVRSDKTLQTLVYKLVPSLFKEEMRRRREFYAAHPDQGIQSTLSLNASELRGEVEVGDDINTKRDEEQISLCLQSCDKLPPYHNEHLCSARTSDNGQILDRRYLLCPSNVTIGHLKKLIRLKFDLPTTYRVDIFYSDEGLRDSYTLLDVAHVYAWRRVDPLKLYYIMHDRSLSQLHLSPPSVKSSSRPSKDNRVLNKRGLSLYTIRMSVSDNENNDNRPKNGVDSEPVATRTETRNSVDGTGVREEVGGQSEREENNSIQVTAASDIGKEDVNCDTVVTVMGQGDDGDDDNDDNHHQVSDTNDMCTAAEGTNVPDEGGGGGGDDEDNNVKESTSAITDVGNCGNTDDDVSKHDNSGVNQRPDDDTIQEVTDVNKNDKSSPEVATVNSTTDCDSTANGSCTSRDADLTDEAKEDGVSDQNRSEKDVDIGEGQTNGQTTSVSDNTSGGKLLAEVDSPGGVVRSVRPTRILSTQSNNNNIVVNSVNDVCMAGLLPDKDQSLSTSTTTTTTTTTNNNNNHSNRTVTPTNGRLNQADINKVGLLPRCFTNIGGRGRGLGLGQRWLLPNSLTSHHQQQQQQHHHQQQHQQHQRFHHQRSTSPRYVTMADGQQYPVLFVGATDTVCPVTFSTGGVPVLANALTAAGRSPSHHRQQHYFIPSSGGHVIVPPPPPSSGVGHACDSSVTTSGETAAKFSGKGELNGEVLAMNGHQRAMVWKKSGSPANISAETGDLVKSDVVGMKLSNGREPLCKLNRKRNRRDDAIECKPSKVARTNVTGLGVDDEETLRGIGGNMAVTNVTLEKHVTPKA
ncbi:hypothetical protein LSH36_122g06025 [Paralvinella palmiformis]|uniref:RING-type domain-containing protein n=1 Tax=Paralvinella palmiformis TaxID=53620 RepID=A0AAD9JXE2_9ANNE|nr:hypothetical protein LSH36_122g06025 [Paralvinella palmiformis]